MARELASGITTVWMVDCGALRGRLRAEGLGQEVGLGLKGFLLEVAVDQQDRHLLANRDGKLSSVVELERVVVDLDIDRWSPGVAKL